MRIPFFRERLACLFRGHIIPEQGLVEDQLALYRGGICERCFRFRQGEFVFNAWDESQTTQGEGGVVYLRGVNPRIAQEGWLVLGNVDELEGISRMILSREVTQKSE